MNFLHPEYFLYFILLGIGIVFIYLKAGQKTNFLSFEDVKSVYGNNSYMYKIYFILLMCISLLFFIIFAQPTYVIKNEKIYKNGIDIEIVLDLSYSMLAEDIQPTRLEVAKEAISGFLDDLESDRVGIIVFAGKPFHSLPLSFEYNIIKKILSKINIDTIMQRLPNMQGTAIGDALILAADSLYKNNLEREKVIILVTDGTANKGVEPLYALEYIHEQFGKNIKIYTVGVGGLEKTFVTLPGSFGNQVLEIMGLDETVLKNISNQTGGKYYRATDKQSFESIFKEISQLEKKEIEVEQYDRHVINYQIYLYILNFIFIVFLFLKMKKHIY